MSRAHSVRRKSIRYFKKRRGSAWYSFFKEDCDFKRRMQAGPFIGTLEDMMKARP